MSTEDNIAIAAVRREFTDALAEVLAANAAGCPVRRGRVARAHAAIKRHPGYKELLRKWPSVSLVAVAIRQAAEF